MSKISSYLSWSDFPRVGSSSVHVLDKLQDSYDENEILESAGHILSQIGGAAKNFNVRRVFFGDVEAMEVYDPDYNAGVVVLGLTLMKEEFTEGWFGLRPEIYC